MLKLPEKSPIVNTIEPLNDDIPRIFLSEGTLPTTKDSTTMKIEYKSKTKTFSGYVDIKCQGTSSMSYPKKNFTIKLYKDKTKEVKMKQNFRGWGSQNKFCLKANWIDVSHARNIVSAKLWGDCVKSRDNFDELLEEFDMYDPEENKVYDDREEDYMENVYYSRR